MDGTIGESPHTMSPSPAERGSRCYREDSNGKENHDECGPAVTSEDATVAIVVNIVLGSILVSCARSRIPCYLQM